MVREKKNIRLLITSGEKKVWSLIHISIAIGGLICFYNFISEITLIGLIAIYPYIFVKLVVSMLNIIYFFFCIMRKQV